MDTSPFHFLFLEKKLGPNILGPRKKEANVPRNKHNQCVSKCGYTLLRTIVYPFKVI